MEFIVGDLLTVALFHMQKRWGDVSTLLDPGRDEDAEMHTAPTYVLDAGKGGSVSRFLNHSCEPNVFIQCILSDHHDVTMPRIVMFAADNIPPLEVCSATFILFISHFSNDFHTLWVFIYFLDLQAV